MGDWRNCDSQMLLLKVPNADSVCWRKEQSPLATTVNSARCSRTVAFIQHFPATVWCSVMQQALSSPHTVCHTFPKILQTAHKISGSHALHVKDSLISCGLLRWRDICSYLPRKLHAIERNQIKHSKTLFKIINSFIFEFII